MYTPQHSGTCYSMRISSYSSGLCTPGRRECLPVCISRYTSQLRTPGRHAYQGYAPGHVMRLSKRHTFLGVHCSAFICMLFSTYPSPRCTPKYALISIDCSFFFPLSVPIIFSLYMHLLTVAGVLDRGRMLQNIGYKKLGMVYIIL